MAELGGDYTESLAGTGTVMSPMGLLPGGLRGDRWEEVEFQSLIWIRLLTWVTKLRNRLEDQTKVVALGAVPDKGEMDLLMRWTCSADERGREA